MNRWPSLALSALLGISMLPACGGGGSQLPSATQAQILASQSGASQRPLAPATLKGQIFLPYQEPEFKQPPVTGHYNLGEGDAFATRSHGPSQKPKPTPTPRPTLTPTPAPTATPTPAPTATPSPSSTPRPSITPWPTPTPAATATPFPLPESLRGMRATIDGEQVAIVITGYWLPEGGKETILDYEIRAAVPKPGYQALEVFNRDGRLLGSAIVQLESDRIRVHDVSPWTTVLLMIARRQASQGGTPIQLLRPAEIQRLGLSPELHNPLAYLSAQNAPVQNASAQNADVPTMLDSDDDDRADEQ